MMQIGHVVMGMDQLIVSVNVRMFLNSFAFMVMVMMFVIVNVCMFVDRHFMHMVMVMFFAHQEQRSSNHERKGNDQHPAWKFPEQKKR